ncbi:DNA-binding MarR family transcriptional regulator [Trinickia symbiotica]|uniref:MarR family transcriptional regulator n=1 Tax=Trinickia symbiotica TaxID=863227 RepID=A0A2N7X8S5_9BURK|nr:MarR family transcriptional regulator [Trinickia symbiotica]PMS38159.1 MarR family transcriptional regulator [Trinickia symbiotica]PPK47158.1 DNA-binding MarR family transcriptional regulator [Trinickia symbiotica]
MRHYTKATFNVTESVGFQLVRARNLIIAEMDGALKEFDISSQQMGILLVLRRKLATTPFEMSKMLGMDTGLMTRMLDKLEAKGLLVRSRDQQDRRVVNLSLTKDGTAVADQVPEVAVEVLNARLKAFTKDEVAELRRLLHKFAGD